MDFPVPGENQAVNSAVPILITHHTVRRPPKIEVEKKFVGFSEGLKRLANNIALKALELVDEAFWAEERTVIDKGDVKSVHYALDIETDVTDPDEAVLVATKVDTGDRPACGAHFQVVRAADKDETVRESEPVLDEEGNNIVRGKTADRPRPRNTRAPRLLNKDYPEQE